MSNLLIDEIKRVERYKLAIPILERALKTNTYCYFAGSLMLRMVDPITGEEITPFDVHPINQTNSEIIQRGEYLVSQSYVKYKKKSCYSYDLALSNIEEYDKAHGRELEPSGTDVIS